MSLTNIYPFDVSLFQCGNMMPPETQCCKWPKKLTSAATQAAQLLSTGMATPRWSWTNLGHSTSSVEPREAVRKARSWLLSWCLRGEGTLAFLRHRLRWSSMVRPWLLQAVLQALRLVWCWHLEVFWLGFCFNFRPA